MCYMLLYDVVENFIERRAVFREAHLTLVREAHEHGEHWLAGPLASALPQPTHRQCGGILGSPSSPVPSVPREPGIRPDLL
jgi:hypothetical protein